MSTASSHTTGADGSAVRVGDAHHNWAEKAKESVHRSEFLRRIATHLQSQLGVGIVAIDASHWSAPAMLVADETLVASVDRESIKQRLAAATGQSSVVDVTTSSGVCRAFAVELTAAPHRSAVLAILPRGTQLSLAQQFELLKCLQDLTASVGELIVDLPLLESSSTTDSQPQPTDEKAAFATSILAGDLSRFHLNLDFNATVYRIANESRRLLGVDRVTVLSTERKRYRVVAVSGVSVIDRRSNSVRASEKLCTAASVLGRSIVLPGENDLSPQIVEPLDAYLDESGVMCVVLLPLARSQDDCQDLDASFDTLSSLTTDYKQSGMMMLEYFTGSPPDDVTAEMHLIRHEATLAMRNALEHRVVFGLQLWKAIGRVLHSNRRMLYLLLATLVIAAIIAGCTIQVDHHIIASGTIEPSIRRQIFANLDGTIQSLHVQDGDRVRAGDVLLELENAEIGSQAESIAGELQTTMQRLASVRSLRLSGDNEPNRDSQLALEQRQLESELENLKSQQTIIDKMRGDLKVTSPIDGRIVAWQVRERLLNRPVSRGNLLLTIVDEESPWQLRLEIADEDAGTVLQSKRVSASLPVRFAVATQPERTFDAVLETVSLVSRLNDNGLQVVDAVADVPESAHPVAEMVNTVPVADASGVRIGTGVTAKIICDRRAALMSWFSDIGDFMHRYVLFYFR